MKKIFAILAVCALALSANATVLTFDDAGGNLVGTSVYGTGGCPSDVTFHAVLQAYGRYVSGSPQGGFAYGTGLHGWTPDVNVSYPVRVNPTPDPTGAITNPAIPNTETLLPYPEWGDSGLKNVLYPWLKVGYSLCGGRGRSDPNFYQYDDMQITFMPRNSKVVHLYGFDIGAYSGSYTLNWDVKNSLGTVITSGTANFTSIAHVAVDPSLALSSTKLVLTVYTSVLGVGAPNIAIDNIEFGQGLASCGDENHPYPARDLNHDCFVNFKDFAIMAESWMKCTNPQPPCSYLP